MDIDDELNNLRAVWHDIHENEEEEAEDRERVMENLEQYGFDQMDQDDIVDIPNPTGSDTPYWKSELADIDEVGERLEEIENSDQSFRPVEDDVLDHLAEDDAEEA